MTNSGVITVIGSSNVDFVMRVETLPGRGETVIGGKFARAFGGKGANQAIAAARLRSGQTVHFVSALGDDPLSREQLRGFQEEGLQCEHVSMYANATGGVALIMCDSGGHNYLAVDPGANDSLSETVIDGCAALIQQSDWLIMQMEIPEKAVERALEIAAAGKTKVLFNYAPARGGLPVSDRMDWLVVNENEASELTGRVVETVHDAEVAGVDLRSRGPRNVAVTLGAGGTVVCSESELFHVPAVRVRAMDTTAAGDTFCGALVIALSEGAAQKDAVRFAGAAAAISVTRAGAQPSIPRRAEVEMLLGAVKP